MAWKRDVGMNADQRANRLPASSHQVRMSPDTRKVSAARMWIIRTLDMTAAPGGMRNGSAM
jgi:hypothetical protein